MLHLDMCHKTGRLILSITIVTEVKRYNLFLIFYKIHSEYHICLNFEYHLCVFHFRLLSLLW